MGYELRLPGLCGYAAHEELVHLELVYEEGGHVGPAHGVAQGYDLSNVPEGDARDGAHHLVGPLPCLVGRAVPSAVLLRIEHRAERVPRLLELPCLEPGIAHEVICRLPALVEYEVALVYLELQCGLVVLLDVLEPVPVFHDGSRSHGGQPVGEGVLRRLRELPRLLELLADDVRIAARPLVRLIERVLSLYRHRYGGTGVGWREFLIAPRGAAELLGRAVHHAPVQELHAREVMVPRVVLRRGAAYGRLGAAVYGYCDEKESES